MKKLLLLKRVATYMQHMFSLYKIPCTVSICENIKKSYTIGLLFIVTEAQMLLLLETSDYPFSLPTNQHNLHSVVCRMCSYVCFKLSDELHLFLSRFSFSMQ